MFRIANVRCNHLINPIGIDCEHPEFSWNLVDSKGQMFQKAYRIQVYGGKNGMGFWAGRGSAVYVFCLFGRLPFAGNGL